MEVERYTNVFDALADTSADAENLRLRSILIIEISEIVKAWGQSQKDAAKRLGLTQPRLNDLLKGKINNFSIDALVKILDAAGFRVDIRIASKDHVPSR